MHLSYFQTTQPYCKIETDVFTGRQKIDCFSVVGNSYLCNTVFEAMRCYSSYCPCQEVRPSSSDADIRRRVSET